MNYGRIVVGVIVLASLVTGAAVYYLQVYGYYYPVAADAPGAEIRLTALASGQPEPILIEAFLGIDADSSPLRFRGCFTTPTSLATLSETYVIHAAPTPLIAPSWFDCFDAARIGGDLVSGAAVGFLSATEIHPGVDRVVAVYPDGRAFAWHQLNESTQ